MILRIVLGTLPPGRDVPTLVAARNRLARAAGAVMGLDSLIVAARPVAIGAASPGPDALPTIEAAIVTVWQDPATMARAVAVDEERRFLGTRLDLPFTVSSTDHYEIVGRTFAALPPESTAFLRILTVRSDAGQERDLVDILRAQQPRLVDLGVVASHLGRRTLPGGDVEAVHVSVWPDRATIRAATHGDPERPLFAQELEAWHDRFGLEMYDGIEIAPRLPTGSGPPLLILDEDRRIVDVTATAAAALGMTPVDLVGRQLDELADVWPGLIALGSATGESGSSVPHVGSVAIHFAIARDRPVPGRHAMLVRRRHEPAPTSEDLDAALARAFPMVGSNAAHH
jgi:hypothetical protein